MVGVWREDPHWHPVLRRETYCCIMELHLCAASGYGRVGFSTQCVPVTGVSGFVPVRRYLWYICWCWVRCKDKLPYNGSLGLLWLTLAKSWHTCMHRQRGEPKPPSGGSAGAELPVCNKAKPRLKQTKLTKPPISNSELKTKLFRFCAKQKYTLSLVRAVFTRAFLHSCAFSKSNIYLIATPESAHMAPILYWFHWCVPWLVRILLSPKKSTNQGPGVFR